MNDQERIIARAALNKLVEFTNMMKDGGFDIPSLSFKVLPAQGGVIAQLHNVLGDQGGFESLVGGEIVSVYHECLNQITVELADGRHFNIDAEVEAGIPVLYCNPHIVE